LHALAKNGTQLWEYYFGAGPENPLPCRGSATAPAVAPDGTVYVGCWDNKLYAFTSGGTLKWTCTAGGAVKTDPSIAKDGTVYFATDEPKLYAVDAAGAVVWAIPLAGAAQGMASIAKDGTLRLPCADGRLYALNAGGTPRWSYITGLSHSSPTLDASGTTYIGSEDGKLYAIRADGSLKWTFSASDEIWAQPTISEDGSLHFLDVASLFYCLGPGAG
jgi:outer membrane protein assembly factor BamB